MSTTLLIVLTVLMSGIFSGLEIAFVSANKFQIELQSKKGTFPFVMLAQLARNPARFIATMLVGNNLMLVLYGLFSAEVLNTPLSPYFSNTYVLLLVQTIMSTLVILFFAEFIPKSLFNTHSDTALTIFALPAWLLYIIFYPVVSLIIGMSNFVLRFIFKVEIPAGEPVFTRLDLDDLLRKHSDSVEDEDEVDPEIEILQNALGFSERKAREFMVPRTEIVALEINDSIDNLVETFVDNGYSKIIIYKKNIDNIIGYVHSYDMFGEPKTIKEVLRDNLFVPESMKANDVLKLFSRERKGLAIVLDEFGGTSGVITLEDVVEEIVGEIDDEHDAEGFLEKVISENKYLFAARLEIDYLNGKYKLDLPEGDNYETLGGLIIDIHESIPETGEIIVFQKYQFEINKVSSNRIEEVIVSVLESQNN